MVERFHRHLKTSLRARLTGPNWSDALPWVLLGIRTAPKEDLKCSSAELVFGAPITVPGDFIAATPETQRTANILPQLRDTVSKFSPTPTSSHGKFKLFVPPDLQHSDYVFIRRDARHSTLQSPYEGPFHVIAKEPKFFKIDFGNKTDTISVDRLKPAHLDMEQPVQVAKPRRRGRPPKKSSSSHHDGSGGESCGDTH